MLSIELDLSHEILDLVGLKEAFFSIFLSFYYFTS